MGTNKDPNKIRPGEMPPERFTTIQGTCPAKQLETLNVKKMTLLHLLLTKPTGRNKKHLSKEKARPHRAPSTLPKRSPGAAEGRDFVFQVACTHALHANSKFIRSYNEKSPDHKLGRRFSGSEHDAWSRYCSVLSSNAVPGWLGVTTALASVPEGLAGDRMRGLQMAQEACGAG